jgi:hypothetical protein
MDLETLQKAKEIESRIDKVKNLINRLRERPLGAPLMYYTHQLDEDDAKSIEFRCNQQITILQQELAAL